MTEMLVWLVETTLIVGILIALICVVGKPLVAVSNVRWGYLIWAVPALRLLLSLLCLLYTSPSPRDLSTSRMPSSA